MNGTQPQRAAKLILQTALGFALVLLGFAGSASAVPQFVSDGAVQNSYGGFDLPLQGSCTTDIAQTTRPLCLALRITAATSGDCTTAGGSWTTSGVCNDTLPSHQNATDCANAGDRMWNAGSSVCAIVMSDDDRNDVTCMVHNGTWSTAGTCVGSWVMPDGDAYSPNVLTWSGTGAAGAGDQCLRCHNTRTQYNSPRVRDTEDTLFMGHRNMSRPVVPLAYPYDNYDSAKPWGGPPFHCVGAAGDAEEECYDNGGNWVPEAPYPGTDTGQDFDWLASPPTVNVGGNEKDLLWIYADWLSAYPRAVYKDDPDTSKNPDAPKVAYSCARCHTTGWLSDSTINYGAGVSAATSTREPEKTFNGVTWNGVDDAVYGQVNLKGGVSGDPNLMASWDFFGIQCSRCHSSAIDRTSNAEYGFSAPAGLASHHSNLTAANFPGGCSALNSACPNGRCSSSNCAGSGGTWYYGYCTDSRIMPGNGNDAAATKTLCETTGASLGLQPPAPGMNGVWITPCSDNDYATQTTCTGAGKTWNLPAGSCSVAGACNDPAMTTSGTCTGTVASGPLTGLDRQWRNATDIIRCDDAGGRWTGSVSQRGQIITNLCMNCHRQEASGLPYDSGSDPAGKIKVSPYHNTVAFPSHVHGNQYLNSPHAKFTGTFSQIATGQFKYDMTGEYKSWFMTEGEAANTGNGCTGCHDVHTSTVTGEKPFAEECTECHAKNLNVMFHPPGKGTPLEEMSTEPMEACVTCHMPGGNHMFRINVDPAYSTFPLAKALAPDSTTCLSYGGIWSAPSSTCTVDANTAPDGDFTKAVWADVDLACGQCHGGGTSYLKTTGSISSGSVTLAVPSSAGFGVYERVKIVGAGAPYYDGDGVTKLSDDFETYVRAIPDGTHVTLAGKATNTVAAVDVIQNPTKNGAGWISKARLAELATGIHNDAPKAQFTYTLGNPNTQHVDFSATASTCGGSYANCNVFNWDFGDGNMGSGAVVGHDYAAPGTYEVKLTVIQYGVGEGEKEKLVTTYEQDLPPVLDAICEFDANTWIMTITDSSSDDHALKQAAVVWGDGSLTTVDNSVPFGPFSHTYAAAGSFNITYKISDSVGQVATMNCTANPNTFAIGGVVHMSDTTTPLGGVKIQFQKGATIVKTVYTAGDGTYLAGYLTPADYTLLVSKTGYTFGAESQTVGPNELAKVINAVSDPLGKVTPGSSKGKGKSNKSTGNR